MSQKGFSLVIILLGILFFVLIGGWLYVGKYFIPLTSSNSGIYGKAVLSPTCPGPGREGEICEAPYTETILIKSKDKKVEIKRFTPDEEGNFKVNLYPGEYLITLDKANTTPPFLKETEATVLKDHFSEVILDIDTGIR